MKRTLGVAFIAIAFMVGVGTPGLRADSIAIVAADINVNLTQAALLATGKFTSVDIFNAISSTPTLAQLSGYTGVLAFTNFIPANATALGNVLADYFDLGGKSLTVATYAFSNPWSIGGRITTGGYAGLTNLGVNGNVSGALVATAPGDAIFSGINLKGITYFHNINFSHPGLGAGATLLATDGTGNNMIARSANGVIDANLFPGSGTTIGNNQEFFNLIGNTLKAPSTVPEPSSLLLFGFGLVLLSLLLARAPKVRGF